MFQKTIHKRVMSVIKDRIAQAQRAHDESVKVLEDKLENDIELLKSQHENNIEAQIQKLVNDIVGKIL